MTNAKVDKQDSQVDFIKLFKPDRILEEQLDCEDYTENLIEDDNFLAGHTDKKFVRANSKALQSFFAEVNQKSSNYITHFDNVLKEKIVPKKISMLKKICKKDDPNYLIHSPDRESSACKVLNYMECPTPYNFAVKNKSETYLMSIDFISENEQFYSFSDFDLKWNYDIGKMLLQIENLLNTFEYPSNTQRVNNIEKIKEDFMMSYLTRTTLIHDGDFHFGNIGFLYNKKDKYIKLINFDLEFPMRDKMDSWYYGHSLKIIRKNYRNVYEKFINKVSAIEQDITLEKLEKCFFHDHTNHYSFMLQLSRNCEHIMRMEKLYKVKDRVFNFLRFNKNNTNSDRGM